MNKCTRCGKENPAEIHTCTPLALRLADHSGDCAEMVKKEWRGLSTAETKVLWNLTKKPREYAQMIEAKLKERNHG